MNYRYQKPHSSLAGYVRTVLVLEANRELQLSNFPLVTNGMPAVVCRNGRATLFGKAIPNECWEGDDAVIYFFMPFIMAPFFNINIRKLMAEPVHFEIDSAENYLLQNLEKNKANCDLIRNVTDQIMFDPSPEILKKLNINERTLQRTFKKFIGITPSQYRRICQFQQSFAQLRSTDFDTLAAVAYENGFADQSHFIRSFKEFSEVTPNDYLKSGLKP